MCISSVLTHKLFHFCRPACLSCLSQGPRYVCQSGFTLKLSLSVLSFVVVCLLFCWLAFLTLSLILSGWVEGLLFGQHGPCAQYSALWFILIKWPQPETGERSSEYGQALSATANLSLLTLAFPLLMLK